MDQDYVMDAENQQQSAELNQNLPAAGNQIPPNGQSSPPIFKLDVDCLDELFDYLSIEEVHSFGQTCKAFQKVAGKYFQWKYPAFRVSYSYDYNFAEKIPDFIQFAKFNEFYQCHNLDEDFVSNCKALKHTCFKELDMTQFIKLLKPILPNLETFIFQLCDIDGDIYENILKHCVQLKCLKLYFDFHEECLLKKYPVLEHIQLITDKPFENDELKKFFRLNPTVRHFATSAASIWINRGSLLESRIKLDDLTIENDRNVNKEAFYALLNDLHQRRFYKRLHLYLCESPSEEQLATLGGLVTLYVEKRVKLPPSMNTLKELGVHADLKEGFNVHEIAGLCSNLERLIVFQTSVHNIMPFIRYSPNLREIDVKNFNKTVPTQSVRLNIFALNSEREKLAGARKVMIYVEENVYLATRWASVEVSLSLVEIRRRDSQEPEQMNGLRSELNY